MVTPPLPLIYRIWCSLWLSLLHSLLRITYTPIKLRCLAGDDFYIDVFEDVEFRDEKDMGNIHSASNLEAWRPVSPQGCFRRSITSWRKCLKLGKSMDADVYEGMTDDGFFFAVMEVPLSDQGHQGKQRSLQLEQEIKLCRQFEHENIVQYIGIDKDDENLYIFLELMSRGSISTLYRKRPLTESQVSTYTSQILKGLKHLHDQKAIHRYINCANILVDASGSVKLAGFGLAEATEMNAAKSLKETFRWMAPEVLNSGKNGRCGLTADIWSLGCTVLEMLTCKPPYSDLGEGTTAQKRSFADRMAAAEVWSALLKAVVGKQSRIDPRELLHIIDVSHFCGKHDSRMIDADGCLKHDALRFVYRRKCWRKFAWVYLLEFPNFSQKMLESSSADACDETRRNGLLQRSC